MPPGSQLQNTLVVRAADIDRFTIEPDAAGETPHPLGNNVAWAWPATLGAFGGFEPPDPYPARYRSVHVDYLIRATRITDVAPLVAADRLRQLIIDPLASAPVAERAAARRV